MYLNSHRIIGFLGKDAEQRFTPKGTPVTTLSIATKQSWKDDKGEWKDRTEWHTVQVWGKRGEWAAQLQSGAHVMVEGSSHTEEYTKDGVKRFKTYIKADEVAKLDRAERRESAEPEGE